MDAKLKKDFEDCLENFTTGGHFDSAASSLIHAIEPDMTDDEQKAAWLIIWYCRRKSSQAREKRALERAEMERVEAAKPDADIGFPVLKRTAETE